MTPAALLAITALSLGTGLSALVLLGLRVSSVLRGLPAPDARLPGSMGIFLRPAWLLEPLMSRALPAARSKRLARELESLGLGSIAPGRWESMRTLQAVTLAGATVLAGGGSSWAWPLLAGLCGFAAGGLWLRRCVDAQARAISRELPGWLDLMTVCVEAGATLTAGIRLIVARAPDSPLRAYFDRVLREVRSGRPRAQSFSYVAALYDSEALGTLAAALAAAESSGLSLGQVLRAQANQRTAERFARAERLAMQAPVKMLGPLILCIFPCTFIVIAVPIAVRLKEAFGA